MYILLRCRGLARGECLAFLNVPRGNQMKWLHGAEAKPIWNPFIWPLFPNIRLIPLPIQQRCSFRKPIPVFISSLSLPEGNYRPNKRKSINGAQMIGFCSPLNGHPLAHSIQSRRQFRIRSASNPPAENCSKIMTAFTRPQAFTTGALEGFQRDWTCSVENKRQQTMSRQKQFSVPRKVGKRLIKFGLKTIFHRVSTQPRVPIQTSCQKHWQLQTFPVFPLHPAFKLSKVCANSFVFTMTTNSRSVWLNPVHSVPIGASCNGWWDSVIWVRPREGNWFMGLRMVFRLRSRSGLEAFLVK